MFKICATRGGLTSMEMHIYRSYIYFWVKITVHWERGYHPIQV